MESDENDRALLRQETASPSEAHDQAVFAAINAAGQRIAERQRRRAPVWRFALPLAAAASLLLVPFWLGQQNDSMRNGAIDGEVFPANASELTIAPERLQWPSQANAEQYFLTLRNSDGDVVLEARTEQPVNSIALSSTDRAKLQPDGSYFWTVRVGDSEQVQIGPYWFDIQSGNIPDPE